MENQQKTAAYQLKITLSRGPEVELVAVNLIRTARNFQYIDSQQRAVTISTRIQATADHVQALREVEKMRGNASPTEGLLIPQRCLFELLQLPAT